MIWQSFQQHPHLLTFCIAVLFWGAIGAISALKMFDVVDAQKERQDNWLKERSDQWK